MRAHLSTLTMTLAAATVAMTAPGCGGGEATSKGAPSSSAGASKAVTAAGAAQKTKPSGGAQLSLPEGRGPDAPFEDAATIRVGPDRRPTLNDGPPTAAVPLPEAAYKPVVSEPLVTALTAWAAKSGHQRVNVHLDRSLGADVLWTVLRSATQAGIHELRFALTQGALPLRSPKPATVKSDLQRAGHLALMIGEAGVNGRVFAGPASQNAFPAYASGGGRPLRVAGELCPAGPRPKSGRIAPALVRTMAEPLCTANGDKPYWVIVAPSVATTTEELLQLAGAAASPASGCRPSVALSTPATSVPGLNQCAAALTPSEVKAYVAKATARPNSGFDAVRAAAKRPFVTASSPGAQAPKASAAFTEKVKREGAAAVKPPATRSKPSNTASVSLGRVVTSDKDASKDVITRALKAPLAEVTECYRAHVKAHEDGAFAGLMGMGFEIKPDGSVNRPGFSKRADAPKDLKLCVAKAAAAWKFPAPDGGTPIQVMVPFIVRKPGTP